MVETRCSLFGRNPRGSSDGLLLIQRVSVDIAVEYSPCFISVLNLDLYVVVFLCIDELGHPRGPNNLYLYEQ